MSGNSLLRSITAWISTLIFLFSIQSRLVRTTEFQEFSSASTSRRSIASMISEVPPKPDTILNLVPANAFSSRG